MKEFRLASGEYRSNYGIITFEESESDEDGEITYIAILYSGYGRSFDKLSQAKQFLKLAYKNDEKFQEQLLAITYPYHEKFLSSLAKKIKKENK